MTVPHKYFVPNADNKSKTFFYRPSPFFKTLNGMRGRKMNKKRAGVRFLFVFCSSSFSCDNLIHPRTGKQVKTAKSFELAFIYALLLPFGRCNVICDMYVFGQIA